MFNHKGGVSKTTTSHHIGWMLTEKGKTVLLVDADSQCNLTKVVIGEAEFEQFYTQNPERNLKSALSPAFDAKPEIIQAVECVPVPNNDALFLLPGSFDLSEYEVSLGVSFTLSESMATLKNLPGSFAFLIDKTAEKYKADYVIIDMNPSLSAINQALLVSSDYFIVPTSPDNFSAMALESLSRILPRWEKWARKARRGFKDAAYPLPDITPKFLGVIIQRFNIRNGKPIKASQEIIDEIVSIIQNTFVENLKSEQMMLSMDKYKIKNFVLAYISDFQTLNAFYQTSGTPVFALTDEQLGASGSVLKNYQEMRDRFYKVFSDISDYVIDMTQ